MKYIYFFLSLFLNSLVFSQTPNVLTLQDAVDMAVERNINIKQSELNQKNSDVITFHTYEGEKLQETIDRLKNFNRPLICTEYMAREFGSTFEFSLPIFKKNNIGCFNWGLVAGKSQTHFGWSTILDLKKKKEEGNFLNEGDDIPEPEVWFHDILRADGSPYSSEEEIFIKEITDSKTLEWK